MPTFREGAAAAAPADTWALYFLFSRVTSSSTPLRVFVCSLFCFTRVSSSGLSCKVLVLLCSARPFHSPRLPSLVLPSSPASCLLSVVFCFPTETNIQSYLLICCLERRRKKKEQTLWVISFPQITMFPVCGAEGPCTEHVASRAKSVEKINWTVRKKMCILFRDKMNLTCYFVPYIIWHLINRGMRVKKSTFCWALNLKVELLNVSSVTSEGRCELSVCQINLPVNATLLTTKQHTPTHSQNVEVQPK